MWTVDRKCETQILSGFVQTNCLIINIIKKFSNKLFPNKFTIEKNMDSVIQKHNLLKACIHTKKVNKNIDIYF